MSLYRSKWYVQYMNTSVQYLENTNESKWYLWYSNESQPNCNVDILIIFDILMKNGQKMTETWPRNDWKWLNMSESWSLSIIHDWY